MANIKVVMIQSVAFTQIWGQPSGKSYAYANVYDLVDTEANDYISKKWAIPFIGWETNPLRPAVIRFPR